MDFAKIQPLLSADRIYANTSDVAVVNSGGAPVALTMWDVSIAALIQRLNVFYVGEAGPGKTQLANDIMNSIFGGKALDLRGSVDLNLKQLFVMMKLDKLASNQGTTEDVWGLTEKVKFNLALIDELNRCPPVIQNQFFNITDGYIEHTGRKVFLGAAQGESYFAGIATGNLGDGVYVGTFAIDNALRDRLHLTLDFDYHYPQSTDLLEISMKSWDPRVKFANPQDNLALLLEAHSALKQIKPQDYLDAWMAALYLDSGLDFVEVPSVNEKSKRRLKNVFPDILVQNGANAAGRVSGFVRPFTVRGVGKTLSLAIGLAAVAAAKSGGEFSLSWETVMEAYKLILPYSGALTPALLDRNYQNPCIATQAVAQEVRKDFSDGFEKVEYALAKASKGRLSNKETSELRNNWEFAKPIVEKQNRLALEGTGRIVADKKQAAKTKA